MRNTSKKIVLDGCLSVALCATHHIQIVKSFFVRNGTAGVMVTQLTPSVRACPLSSTLDTWLLHFIALPETKQP